MEKARKRVCETSFSFLFLCFKIVQNPSNNNKKNSSQTKAPPRPADLTSSASETTLTASRAT